MPAVTSHFLEKNTVAVHHWRCIYTPTSSHGALPHTNTNTT